MPKNVIANRYGPGGDGIALAAERRISVLNAMPERPIVTLNKPDVALALTRHPSLISGFTGQPNVKEQVEIAVAAAFVLPMPR